jgi:hypothetical protein
MAGKALARLKAKGVQVNEVSPPVPAARSEALESIRCPFFGRERPGTASRRVHG